MFGNPRSAPSDGNIQKQVDETSSERRVKNASEGINDRFLDCEFNVIPGFISEQLLARIKQHVSSTVDDSDQECTLEVYANRIVFQGVGGG